MKRFVLLSLMVLTLLTSQAQTLDECCKLARENYPEIRQYDLISKTEQCAEGEGGFGGREEQVVLWAAFEDHSLPPR